MKRRPYFRIIQPLVWWLFLPLSALLLCRELGLIPLSLYGFSGVLFMLLVVYSATSVRRMRRTVIQPLTYFRTTLEDHAEGFMHTDIPDTVFARADAELRACYEAYIEVNRMMLKHVDSLEKGYEEERLAKLAQSQLTAAYERFVPKEFIRYLDKSSIVEVALGDHVKLEMTVLYSDIRSFTSLAERLSPDETFRLLNTYLHVMEPVVKRHHGFIDKYIGDAIMALFHREADDAVKAAVDMLHELRVFNDLGKSRGQEPIEIGIGINTGSTMLGIVGGEGRREGTVISDAVNVSARMEELNKSYGTSLLISEPTLLALSSPDSYAMRFIARTKMQGKSIPIAIYEIFEADAPELRERKQATRPLFEEACAHFHEHRYEQALTLFDQCVEHGPDDQAARRYLERCRQLLLHKNQVNS